MAMMIELMEMDPGTARLALLLQSGADPNILHEDVSGRPRRSRCPVKTQALNSRLSDTAQSGVVVVSLSAEQASLPHRNVDRPSLP